MSATLQYNQMPNPIPQQPMLGGDIIKNLPVTKDLPSTNEIHLVNSLFTEPNKSAINKIMSEGKDSLILGILFIILSLEQVDIVIKKVVPITTKSLYILLILKAVILMVSWWFIKNFYLSRKE